MDRIDSYAVSLALIGITVVTLALITVMFAVKLMVKLNHIANERKHNKTLHNVFPESKKENNELSGNTVVAIATALYLHFQEMHDESNQILTIKRVNKKYSPWNSKIYFMTQKSVKK